MEELNTQIEKLQRKVKRVIEAQKILVENELDNGVFIEGWFGVLSGRILKIGALDELKPLVKKLHTLFPEMKRIGHEIWSPYDEKAICAWNYRLYKDAFLKLQIWLETDIYNVPGGLLSPKCTFKKQQSENYTLVCEK
jgi:hypothetical protein